MGRGDNNLFEPSPRVKSAFPNAEVDEAAVLVRSRVRRRFIPPQPRAPFVRRVGTIGRRPGMPTAKAFASRPRSVAARIVHSRGMRIGSDTPGPSGVDVGNTSKEISPCESGAYGDSR